MTSLLLQSCSATKESVDNPVPALKLYDGYFFKIIKKALRTNKFRSQIDIFIISAKYGIVNPDEEIEHYDQRMKPERAKELNGEIIPAINAEVRKNNYDDIWINLGKDYLPAVDGIEAVVDIPVKYIEGSGIGMKGKQLKDLVTTSGEAISAQGD